MTTGPGLSEIWIIDPRTDAGPIEAIARRFGIDAAPPPVRLTSEADAARRAVAYLALRLMIAAHDGVERSRQPFLVDGTGKPRLPAPGVDFSLAHCDGLALVAVARDTPVGVDVLAAGPMTLSTARRDVILRSAEAVAAGRPIAVSDVDDRLRQAWARLEAVAKATDLGIGGLLELLGARPGHAAPDLPPDLPVATDLALPAGFFGAVACRPNALRGAPTHVTGVPSIIERLVRDPP